MRDDIIENLPKAYLQIEKATKEAEFSMASDVQACSLLRTLAAAKPKGKFLELGTGSGLSTSWILDGMDSAATLVSLDNDKELLNIAAHYLKNDQRLSLVNADGSEWLSQNSNQKFDYVFADTWHGKYLLLDETLAILNKGGFYIIDDMLPQENWPEGHEEKAIKLVETLEQRTDLVLTKQNWASGMLVAVKR